MKSYSQAYQDLYVLAMTGKKLGGTYLDIGCYTPKEGNNTYLLETEFGWDGLSIDKYSFNFHIPERRSRFIQCDATQPYPIEAFGVRDHLAKNGHLDYLSLDIDEDTNAALLPALIFAKYSVITIEHDLYARGKDYQDDQRRTLRNHGYVLHVADVFFPGNPQLIFEDWWCLPELAFDCMDTGTHDAENVIQKLWMEKFNEEALV